MLNAKPKAILAAMLLVTVATSQAQPSIGAGLEGISDWSRSNAFADLVRQSRGFGTPGEPWKAAVPTDSAGWPTVDFGTILGVWSGMQGVGGTYKISGLCNAKPTIELTASPGTINNLTWNATSKAFSASLDYPDNGDQLMLTFRNTNGGIRKLHVMRPGYSVGTVFTTPLLDHFKRFSTLRFMDWTSTNGNSQVDWANRPIVAQPSYAINGVPWEVCIDLANTLKKDLWINVPAKATPAYVVRLATLLRDRTDPSLHIYVEYSNEVWNWGFEQATWNQEQAKAEVAAGGSPLNYDGETNEGVWAARRIVKRLYQISGNFKTVFGSSYATRVRPVLATQVAWPGHWLVEGLKFADNYYGGASKFVYAVAGAPYFNLGTANDRDDLTTDDVLAALSAGVDFWKTDLNLEACATMARFHNVKLVAYEGGPDTFGPHSVTAKKAASLDPRMQAICQRYLKVWYGYGADLFNWFVGGATSYDDQYGTWGITNDMTNQTAPKILAVDVIRGLKAPLALNQGAAVPGSVDARRFMFRDANWLTQPVTHIAPWDWQGAWRDYFLRATQTATCKVSLAAAADQAGGKVQLLLNGKAMGVWNIPVRTDGTYAITGSITVPLEAGMQAIRLKLTGTVPVRIKTIRFVGP